MRTVARLRAVFFVIMMCAGSSPAELNAQRLATDDPVLQDIWDQAINNSHLESLARPYLIR